MDWGAIITVVVIGLVFYYFGKQVGRDEKKPPTQTYKTDPKIYNSPKKEERESRPEDVHFGANILIRVAGVSFENRQEVISRIKENDRLVLKLEPDNPFDKNAIKVNTKDGQTIGYIPKEYNEQLTGIMEYINAMYEMTMTLGIFEYLDVFVEKIYGRDIKGVLISIMLPSREHVDKESEMLMRIEHPMF